MSEMNTHTSQYSRPYPSQRMRAMSPPIHVKNDMINQAPLHRALMQQPK
jgi:hypothetical protein